MRGDEPFPLGSYSLREQRHVPVSRSNAQRGSNPRAHHGKHDRIKDGAIGGIERAVDEECGRGRRVLLPHGQKSGLTLVRVSPTAAVSVSLI